MAGFMTYWTKQYIKNLNKAGDNGKLSVIFGSHHTSMPSISRINNDYRETDIKPSLCGYLEEYVENNRDVIFQ